MDLLIKHADIITPRQILPDQDVWCREGRIASIGSNLQVSSEAVVFEANGHYLVPGFIDLHMHGLHHHLLDDGEAELHAICRLLPRYGVTGFLPTLCPKAKGADAAYVRSLAATKPAGACVLGFHLEGPYLKLTGALPAAHLNNADRERAEALIEAAQPYPAVFSVSPDFENAMGLIPVMAQDRTVPVFITHTQATVAQTRAAINAGACHATHFYDVFPPPPQADPGVRPCGAVEAILADPKVTVDFILDGEHVDPVAVKMALACKGADSVCLITDANRGAGLTPGRYQTVGYEVEFRYPGSPARGTENSPYPGLLSGSGLTMDQALRNAVKFLGVELTQAVQMASTNPARVLRREDKGCIREGADADLVLLDRDLNVRATWIHGINCFTHQT